MKKITTLILALFLTINCTDNDDIANTTAKINFNFKHTWNNTLINDTSINTSTLTTQNGEIIKISRIRYLISRFELVDSNGNSYQFEGYKFTNLSDTNTYNFTPSNNTIPVGNYTLKFIWGFNETDNVNSAYPDLNVANWNWPTMLGGGYHFLQMDGIYKANTSTPSPFNYHNGTARVSTNPNEFEQNFAEITFTNPIVITDNKTINIKMDFAEFFKNPHTWDLNTYDTPLMPNYTAQKMMQDNVMTVFSIE